MSSIPSSVKRPQTLSVLLPIPLNHPFHYLSSQSLKPGTLVKVPFGSRQLYGIVWKEEEPAPSKPLKPLLLAFENVGLPDISLKFMERVSEYTLTPRGQILKMILPTPEAFDSKRKPRARMEKSPPSTPQKPQLTLDQWIAAEDILKSLEGDKFQPFLLEGVTGSGKTEVYFEAIDHVLQKRGQALVMLPEIALSAQWLQRFETRFGFQPALWHSDLGKGIRKEMLRTLLEGTVPVIVGTRSALFLPFPNLKLIIVDEEHDGSYKQEEGVIYNARDMAVLRAYLGHITCILASATPSLETELNVKSGKYRSLHLTSRFGSAEMPTVNLIDLRLFRKGKGEPPQWISPPLRQALQETLARQEQAMLFLNRRGFAPLLLCQGCGHRLMCPQCSVSLVHHKFQDKLLCHHCSYSQDLPKACPSCNEENTFSPLGPGVERIYEEVKAFLPEARCSLMTSDHLTTPQKIFEQVQQIQAHEVDILIGTQIMAKGHHFPLLTLVGIVDGDSALSGSDLRASEKTFQLLHQVAGRSGREQKRGHVFLQTHLPEHPVMQALLQQDRAHFFALESEQRMIHGFPPYGRLSALILSGKKEEDVQKSARHLARIFPLTEKAELLGPTPAPLSFLRGRHRWRLLLKTDKDFPPQPLLKTWLSAARLPTSVRLQIDMDPYSFY